MKYWITILTVLLATGCATTNGNFNQKEMIAAAHVELQTFEYETSTGNDTGYTLKELTLMENK